MEISKNNFLTANRDKLLKLIPNEQLMMDICSHFIHYCSIPKLTDENDRKDVIYSEKVNAILNECISLRKSDIFQAFILRCIRKQYAYLVNYDWSLSYVLSNNQISDVRKMLLKLTFIFNEPADSKNVPITSSLTFELTKEEVIQFISFLKKIKKNLYDQLSKISINQ